MRQALFLFFFIGSTVIAVAQNGSISGVVKDAATSEGLIGANVVIEGTQLGSPTDIEGKFKISNLKPGSYTLLVTFVTYKTDTISSVVVEAGKDTKVNSTLQEAATELTEVEIRGTADRTSESTLLSDRKASIQMVQGIGAQELSRKGVSNAEAAVVQITGVSKQQGVKNVFVRGLGDRYNSTSLNGLPLPSEDPEYKNITLDFFSSDIINSIDVNKTYGAKIYGDVGGANINIVSKRLFDDQELNVSVSAGVNSQTVSNDFLRADGATFFGNTDKTIPITDLKQYDFPQSYQPNPVSGPKMNSSFSISGGKNFNIKGNSLKTFVVATMSNNFLYKQGVARQVTPTGGIRQDLNYDKYEYNVSQLLLGSVTYEYGNGNELTYNAILIHDNKQSVGNYTGYNNNGVDDITDPNAYNNYIRRQQVNDNVLLVNQLISETKLSEKLSLDVRGSFNTIRGDEPDRRQNFYIGDGENHYPNPSSQNYNHRYFSTLRENDIAANAALIYNLGSKPNNNIAVGYNFRSTIREFEATQFNFDFETRQDVDINNPDALFNQQSLDNGLFTMETSRGSIGNAFKPFTYNGDRLIHGGFVNFDYQVSSDLTINLGTRFEKIRQEIRYDTNLDEDNPNLPYDNMVVREPFYFLPSVNVKYNFSENDIVRLASSKTYTFQQFKEIAPFLYEDVNFASFGNQYLLPAENLNLDLRFEHYFVGDQLIAVTGFYKHIDNAINRVQVSSAANELSYVNTGNANAAGAEIELRKGLFNIVKGSANNSLTIGLNVSYLYSKQELTDVDTDQLTVLFDEKESALEGASTWLTNSDITFTREGANNKKIMSSVVFNFFSDRIYSLGAPTGNKHIMENGIPRLDWISKVSLTRQLSMSLNIRNILNPESRLTKELLTGEDEVIGSYKRGVSTSIGLSYKF